MRTAEFFIFCRKKLSIVPPRASIESFFLHFYKNNYLRLCVAFWQSAFWKICVSPAGPLPFPAGFPRMRMILFAVLYIIYKLLRFVSFMLFFQRRRFLAILFAFFVYFYVLSKILGEFFVQNKTRNTKRRFFLFFSSVVRKFLSISLFALCALPFSAGKAANRFFHCAAFFSQQRRRKLSFRCLVCPQPLAYCEFFSVELRVLFCQNQQKRTLSTAEYFSFFVGRKLFFHRNFSLNSAEENSQSTYYI